MQAEKLLSNTQQQQINDHVEHLLALARDWFPSARISTVSMSFDLRGQTAGKYYPAQCLVRFNPFIAAKHFEHYVSHTVTHEIAHHVIYQLFGTRRQTIRPHGIEWQALMQRYGVPPQRCHSYDTSDLPVREQRRFDYHCDCSVHQLSATRHNRIKKGQRYSCKQCRSVLKPVADLALV